ncbi:MAG: hypothetical protein ACQEP1_00475 [Nanobdellota archaeon]
MRFSKAELGILDQVARGNKKVKSIATALNNGQRRIYGAVKELQDKEFVILKKGSIEPKEGLHITLLLQALAKTPDMPKTLADSRMPLLTAILNPSTIKDIEKKPGLRKSIIYRYIKELRRRNLIRKEKERYVINQKIWPKLTEALTELKRFEENTDRRIPKSSIIYRKKNKEIIFSCKEDLDATLTAFSAYEKYGIRLFLTQNYYSLPKKTLNKKDILLHSLYIVEKEKDMRLIIFLALFYAKYKKEFPEIFHETLDKINKILKKQKIRGFPTYEEIKDRAEVYNIKI